MATKEAYDFKGNSISERRQFAADYRSCPDWSGDVPLDPEVFSSSSTHDALNRIVTATLPDGSTVRPVYNEASLFDAVDVNVRGERADGKAIWTTFIAGLDYDARRQRQQIALGSGVATTYEYDPLTFRLIRLRTARGTEFVQDLSYTYDPSGNITTIRDAAQPAVYFRNIQVDARNDYLYDAIFRLRRSDGPGTSGAARRLAGSADPAWPHRNPAGPQRSSGRWPGHGSLRRALHLRRRRQHAVDASPGQRSGASRLDPDLFLRRGQRARRQRRRQPSERDARRRQLRRSAAPTTRTAT